MAKSAEKIATDLMKGRLGQGGYHNLSPTGMGFLSRNHLVQSCGSGGGRAIAFGIKLLIPVEVIGNDDFVFLEVMGGLHWDCFVWEIVFMGQ